MTDMPGQGKVKRSSAVLPIYVDKKGNLDLRVAPKKFIIGKYPNMNQVVKTLKAFKKSDLEEYIKKSMNENISDSQKFKIYNSLKKGDIVSIKYDSTIAKGSKFHPFLVTKGKTKLMKGKIERIIMVPAGGSKAKRYLYNRNGSISLALGDMAAVIVDMKKGEVKEGSCGYGEDGKLGKEPAGPHLLKKKKIKEDIEMSKGVKKLMKIADEGFGKVGGTTVDSMSASLFKQIYNKVNDDIKKKLNQKNEKQLVRIIAGMWKKFGKNVSIGSSL
jgi:ribosomal protein L21E